MDRPIVYPSEVLTDGILLTSEQNTMVALGYALQAALGTSTLVDGLALTPTTVASMTLNIGPGSIIAFSTLEATAYGSLSADTVDSIVKMGVNTTTTQVTLTAPITAGQSINYLIEATFAESDDTTLVLPYYNASNPAIPYNGPANAGTSQNTRRKQRCSLQLKAGTAATTGTQTTPAVDGGWVGLYAVTVNYGQSTITTANLASGNPNGAALIPTAPFIPFKLGPAMNPGFSREYIRTTAGTYTFVVPAGVTSARVHLYGGGASGGAGGATSAANDGGGGGGAGGYCRKLVTGLTPGTSWTIVIGAGGAAPGTTSSPGNAGSASTIAALSMTANGGAAGTQGGAVAGQRGAGGAGGTASGGDFNLTGGFGYSGAIILLTGGNGCPGGNGGSAGGQFGGPGGLGGYNSVGAAGSAPGGGGGAGDDVASGGGVGGAGAAGGVIIEY